MGNYRFIHPSIKELIVTKALNTRQKNIAKHLNVSKQTVSRTLRLWGRTGAVVCRAVQVGRPRELNVIHCLFLEACIQRTPDLFLSELKDELHEAFGVQVSDATILRTLRRRGYTRKVVSRPARERDEDKRDQYILNIALNFLPCQLVFVDEAHYNRHVSRRTFAWARNGHRACRSDFFVRGQRYTITPALSLDGIIHVSIQPKSHTSETFCTFIEGLLDEMNPFPQPNSVIIMDNASIHKSDEMRATIEARGMRLVYLPPYSPDLNPIEESFSSMKSWLRRHRDYVLAEMTGERVCNPYRVLFEAVGTVTPDKALGWFRDSGYVA